MDKICVIYKIQSPTNNVYIGQTRNFRQRHNRYKNLHCEKQVAIYKSIKKHGFENHSFEILQELPNDIQQEHINNLEIAYIESFKECGFEMLNIKGGGSNGKLSKETIEKIRLVHLGKKKKPLSEAQKKHLSIINSGANNPNYGKKKTETWYKSMREKTSGEKHHMYGKSSPIAKMTIDLQTGFVFDSLNIACKSLNVNYNTARTRMNKLKSRFIY